MNNFTLRIAHVIITTYYEEPSLHFEVKHLFSIEINYLPVNTLTKNLVGFRIQIC